jgi:hypothetical protein
VSGKRSSRWRWVAVFAVIAALAVGGILLNVWWNLDQQLTPQKLEQAEALWRANGPKDYDLSYQVTYDRERLAERHVVLVRGGEVAFASCEGEVVEMAPALAAVVGFPLAGSAAGAGRDVPAIFAHIRELLEKEQATGRRNFIVAVFDPQQGYPRRFVWRVRRSDRREEWDVRLWPPGELEKETRK